MTFLSGELQGAIHKEVLFMRKLTWLLFLFVFLSGCTLPFSHVVISPLADISSLERIAVWKFRDGGTVANSGDIATRAIESALMKKGFRLVAYSKIRDVLSIEISFREGMTLDAGMLTPRVLQRIREETDVDALILGSVSEAWYDPAYLPPCWIGCAFQMIDTKSGEIIISANASDDGYSLQSAARQMAEKAIKKIKR